MCMNRLQGINKEICTVLVTLLICKHLVPKTNFKGHQRLL